MQVGGLALFSPSEGGRASDVREMFVAAVGRDEAAGFWRKRARRSVTSLGQWGWDPGGEVDLDYHVQYSALPQPAGMAELWALVSWLHATPLDRDRPLWEMHLIEGLADGRYAVYIKIHHALADGVSAMGMLRAALSADPGRREGPALWEPDGLASEPAPASPRGGLDLLRLPSWAVAKAWSTAREAAGLVPALTGTLERALRHRDGPLSLAAPRTMLNVPIDGARSFTGRSWPLERLRLVAKHSEASVNDVVLAMCAGALRSYLTSKGALPWAPLVAMVPVSLHGTRPEGGRGGTADAGNKIGSLTCGLATNLANAGDRLAAVQAGMRDGKSALAARSQLQVLAMSALRAPLALGMLVGQHRLLRPPNVMISNVSGSPAPLYWNGARLDALYPLSIPVAGQALNITCTSTDDTIAFGLTGCRHAVPGLGAMTGHLDDELRLLECAAGL